MNEQAVGIDVSKKKLDICVATDPAGPAEGLFKADFFRDCHRVLAEGGIIVQQSESPLLHSDTIIKDLHANMREADATGKGVETKYYTAAQHKGALVLPPFMEKAIKG